MNVSADVLKAIEKAKAEGRVREGGKPAVLPSAPDDWTPGDVTEKEFTKLVIDEARRLGWLVAHFRPAWVAGKAGSKPRMVTPVAGDGKGFPDLVLVRELVVWCELKVGRNKPTPEQEHWFSRLRAAGQPVFLWYPRDWPEIVSILQGAKL